MSLYKQVIPDALSNLLLITSSRNKTRKKVNPGLLFEERKKVFIKLPYCAENEKLSRSFLKKLHHFTDGKFIFIIMWQTRKIGSLFKLKDVNKDVN